MENILFIVNTIVLIFVLSYGISFGFANWFKKILVLVIKRYDKVSQNSWGKFLDALWLVAFIYLFTIGREFNNLFLGTFFSSLW